MNTVGGLVMSRSMSNAFCKCSLPWCRRFLMSAKQSQVNRCKTYLCAILLSIKSFELLDMVQKAQSL